jgi:hypothetical protein
MFNRIEKALTLRSLMLAAAVMGSASSSAFATAPAHMAARADGVHTYSPNRASTDIQMSGPIFSRGYYLGQDPDASIRFQLLRDGFYGTR